MHSPRLELLLVCIGVICILWLIYSLTIFLTGVRITADGQDALSDDMGADEGVQVGQPVHLLDAAASIEALSNPLRRGAWLIDSRTADLGHPVDETQRTQGQRTRITWSPIAHRSASPPMRTRPTASGRVLHHFGERPPIGRLDKEHEL